MDFKFQILLVVCIVVLFGSCKNIATADLKGTWCTFDSGPVNFRMLQFGESQVRMMSGDDFVDQGNFQLTDNEISINLERDSILLVLSIESLVQDTLVLFNGSRYYRRTGESFSMIEPYKLIGVESSAVYDVSDHQMGGKIITHTIHYFRNKNFRVNIRAGDIFIDFIELPLFLQPHHNETLLLVYLGEKIELSDLKKLYFDLKLSAINNLLLSTKLDGIDRVHIFSDILSIWENELNDYIHEQITLLPPPPSMPILKNFASRDNFLNTGGSIFNFTSQMDFSDLPKLIHDVNYVISISTDCSLEKYLAILTWIKEERSNGLSVYSMIE